MNPKDITYSINKNDIKNLSIGNFFVGWPNKPSIEILKQGVERADYAVLAIDTENNMLAGYITAITDHTLSAYIPFLEVEETYQKQGIGHELVTRILEQLQHLYMIDLVCDKELADFYSEAGFESWHAMIKRNYANQSGCQQQ